MYKTLSGQYQSRKLLCFLNLTATPEKLCAHPITFLLRDLHMFSFTDFQEERLQKADSEYNEELDSITDEFDTERFVQKHHLSSDVSGIRFTNFNYKMFQI